MHLPECHVIAKPELPGCPLPLRPGARITIGRDLGCSLRIPDPVVSRMHAHITWPPESSTPIVTDCGSQNGIRVNDRWVPPKRHVPLQIGDRIVIGRYALQLVGDPSATPAPTLLATIADAGADIATQYVREEASGHLAGRRLNLLMDAASCMPAATDESGIFKILAQALLEGSGFRRVLILRTDQTMADCEILTRIDRDRDLTAQPAISRTLLRAAAGGGPVRLRDRPEIGAAVSIDPAAVRAALCLPLDTTSPSPTFAYLDGRSPGADESEAVTFCTSVTRLAELSISGLRRRHLEVERERKQRDLRAARRAQTALWPPEAGEINGVRYHALLRPGAEVGGDALGIVPVTAERTLIVIGDVSGKGIGAGITANSLLSHVMALATVEDDPARIIAHTNRFACRHTSDGAFMTMMILLVDDADRRVTLCDAGHGFLVRASPNNAELLPSTSGGYPLGIESDCTYTSQILHLSDDERLILFTDGLFEQPAPDGTQFGLQRIPHLLKDSARCEDDIASLLGALQTHAATEMLADDVTILSVQWRKAHPNGNFTFPPSHVDLR